MSSSSGNPLVQGNLPLVLPPLWGDACVALERVCLEVTKQAHFFGTEPFPFVGGENFWPQVFEVAACLRTCPYSARLLCAICAAGVGKTQAKALIAATIKVFSGNDDALIDADEKKRIVLVASSANKAAEANGLEWLATVFGSFAGDPAKALTVGSAFLALKKAPSRLVLNLVSVCLLSTVRPDLATLLDKQPVPPLSPAGQGAILYWHAHSLSSNRSLRGESFLKALRGLSKWGPAVLPVAGQIVQVLGNVFAVDPKLLKTCEEAIKG